MDFDGETVANATYSKPVFITASGNSVTTNVQVGTALAVAPTDKNDAGLVSFDDTSFNVDSNGFVTIAGGSTVDTFNVDAHTAPGTDPVVPDGAGVVTITGGQVAAGVIGANVIRTDSLTANSYTIEIQRSTAVALANSINNGVSHFDSSMFSVDNSGFVSLLGGGQAIDTIGTQTGTNPIVPTAAGLVTLNGAVVAAGTNPVRSNGTGANTVALQVQISQAIAATDATKIGLSNFSSANFTVDANGFVALAGTGGAAIQTITGDSNGAEVPLAGNFNILGSGSITTVGSANTETVQLTGLTNHAVLVGAGTSTITKVGPSASTGQILQNNAAADPSYSTATYPSIATGTGTLLRADGTNWVATTSTYPNTNAVSTLLYASSANVMSALSTVNRAALSTNSTGVPTWLAMTDGQVIIGSSAGSPAAANITSTGATVTITNSSNGINLEVAAGGFTWTDATNATYTLAVENGYVSNRGGGVTFTLPSTATLGAEIIIVGKLGLWTIAQNALQQIVVGSASSTIGVTGTVASTNLGDCITLVAITAGSSTLWRASSFVGNLTVT